MERFKTEFCRDFSFVSAHGGALKIAMAIKNYANM